MIRYFGNVSKPGCLIAGGLVSYLGLGDADEVKTGKEYVKTKTTTGWERVRKVFELDDFGDMSKELSAISQTAMFSSFLGICFGGIVNSKTAYMDFMRNNTASKFTSHLEAKRKLQDTISTSFGIGAWKWGWRIGLFSTSFVSLTTLISAYRDENGILEFVLAGLTTGAMYKWQMGPRGWIVGGAVGATLGLTSGTLTYGLLKLTGVTMDELRDYQKKIGSIRRDLATANMKEYLEKEDDLLRNHNTKVLEETENVKDFTKGI